MAVDFTPGIDLEKEKRRHKRIFRFFEFFIVGFLFGVVEDLIVVAAATDDSISLHTVWVAAFVALPFAVISEVIVDKPEVREYIMRKVFGHKNNSK